MEAFTTATALKLASIFAPLGLKAATEGLSELGAEDLTKAGPKVAELVRSLGHSTSLDGHLRA